MAKVPNGIECKSSESVQLAMLKACDACTHGPVIAHCTDSEDFPHRNIAENFNRLSRVHERYRRQTDDTRQTDGRRHISNMNMSSSSLKTRKSEAL